MVCPVCRGKSEVGVFCTDCYLEKNLKIELPGSIDLLRCKGCGIYIIGSKKVESGDEEEIILKAVNSSLKTNVRGLEKSGIIKFEVLRVGNDYAVTVVFTIGETERRAKTLVRIRNTSCQDCSRIAGGYYEAVLQLRGGISKKDVDSITKTVEGHKDRYAFVNKIEKAPGGFDIYLGSKKSAEKIVSNFRGKAEIKKSFMQAGFDRHAGKAKYRFYYLIRL